MVIMISKSNAVRVPRGMSPLDFERIFIEAYRQERREHPTLPDNVIEVIVRDHLRPKGPARPNIIRDIASIPFDIAGRVYGGAKQVVGDVVTAGKTVKEWAGPSEFGKRMREKMLESANPRRWVAGVDVKEGALMGWTPAISAARRREILARVARKDGYATVIRRLVFLANVTRDRETRAAAKADIGWVQSAFRPNPAHRHALAQVALTNPPEYHCLICDKMFRRVS